jgi:hypothetical protein
VLHLFLDNENAKCGDCFGFVYQKRFISLAYFAHFFDLSLNTAMSSSFSLLITIIIVTKA